MLINKGFCYVAETQGPLFEVRAWLSKGLPVFIEVGGDEGRPEDENVGWPPVEHPRSGQPGDGTWFLGGYCWFLALWSCGGRWWSWCGGTRCGRGSGRGRGGGSRNVLLLDR